MPNVAAFSKGLDSNWLAHRFELFETYCLPSVLNQTSKKFIWNIYFHPDSPPEFQSKISAIASKHDFINIVYTPVYNSEVLNGSINTEGYTYLITSRLDNDDAIAKNFVELVQNSFSPNDLGFINFPYAAGYHVAKMEFYSYHYNSNPFISVIEKVKEVNLTALEFDHSMISKHYSIQNIKTDIPMSLTVEHDNNVINRVSGCVYDPVIIQNHFHIHLEFAGLSFNPTRRMLCQIKQRMMHFMSLFKKLAKKVMMIEG